MIKLEEIKKQLEITNELLFWIAIGIKALPSKEEIRIRRRIPYLRKQKCAICTHNYRETGIEPNCMSCPLGNITPEEK